MVSAVPQIEGLTVEDILGMYKAKPALLKHIPEERDWVHTDRKWLCDVLFTIDKAGFQNSINDAIKRRKQRLEASRDLMVEMRPEFVQALNACMNFSSKDSPPLTQFSGEWQRCQPAEGQLEEEADQEGARRSQARGRGSK